MVKMISGAGRLSGRLFVMAMLTGLLVGCGGGGGDTAPADADNDGIPDIDDPDADGDGVADIDDTFVDLDMDGFDDLTGLTEAQATSLVLVPTQSQPCGNQPASATDNNSTTANWDDNCFVARSINSEAQGALLADSLYAVGIQRVVYCLGNGAGATYVDFADGEYAEGSETALIAFQNSESLPADGLIGPATWGALQASIELLVEGDLDNNGNGVDTYGFDSGRCAGTSMFYQSTALAGDGLSIVRGGWTLARNQPNEAQSIPYSYQPPFGRL